MFVVGWPYLVQEIVPRIDWVNKLFLWVANDFNWPQGEQRMVYETPPIVWGLVAAVEAIIGYLPTKED
jgi:hypothetical protein